MAWTDEQKQQAKQMYLDAKPTAETSTEIVKEIAEKLEQTVNGVRMVLVQENVYVKKAEAAAEGSKPSKSGSKTGSGTSTGTRVSKESSIKALKDLITEKGGEVDDEILDKLTGKAAVYLVAQFSK